MESATLTFLALKHNIAKFSVCFRRLQEYLQPGLNERVSSFLCTAEKEKKFFNMNVSQTWLHNPYHYHILNPESKRYSFQFAMYDDMYLPLQYIYVAGRISGQISKVASTDLSQAH